MSVWKYRIDTRQSDMAHGITFHMFERKTDNTRGEASYKEKKLHLDGTSSLTIALNQWKYGDELIAQIFTKDLGLIKERRADGYNRVQIYLGPADINTAETLENMAAIIRNNIKG